MPNQPAAYKWKPIALAMMLLLLFANVVTQLPFDNFVSSIEQVEECSDCLEDISIVSHENSSSIRTASSKVKHTDTANEIAYSNPYYRIVYPPPEVLINV